MNQEFDEDMHDYRLKEELQFAAIDSIKRLRNEGGMTLADIARLIQEAVGDDDATLAGLLMVMAQKKPVKKINYYDVPRASLAQKAIANLCRPL